MRKMEIAQEQSPGPAVVKDEIEFRLAESIFGAWQEFKGLTSGNNMETGLLKDEHFEPDTDRYKILDESGALRTYTVHVNGMIIGYSVFLIHNHQLYKNIICATQDMLYISQFYRGKKIGFDFIQWCDKQVTELGVDMINRSFSIKNDISKILEGIGYKLAEKAYSKVVNPDKIQLNL